MNKKPPSPSDKRHGFEFLRGTSYSRPPRQRTHSHSGYYYRDNSNNSNFNGLCPPSGYRGKGARHFNRTFKCSRPVITHNLPPRMQSVESGHSSPIPIPNEPLTDKAQGDVKLCTSPDKGSTDAYGSENFEKGDHFRARSQSPDDGPVICDSGSEFSKSRPESPDFNQFDENASQIQFLSAPYAKLDTNLQDRLKVTLTKLKDLNCNPDIPMDNTCMYAEAEKISSRIDSDRKYFKARYLESPKPLSPSDSPPLILKDCDNDQLQVPCSSSYNWNQEGSYNLLYNMQPNMYTAPVYNLNVASVNYSRSNQPFHGNAYSSVDFISQTNYSDEFHQVTYPWTNRQNAYSVSPPCSSGSYPQPPQCFHPPSPDTFVPFNFQQKSLTCCNHQEQQQYCPPTYRSENDFYSGPVDFSVFPSQNGGMQNKNESISDRSSIPVSTEPMDPAPSTNVTTSLTSRNKHATEITESFTSTTASVCKYEKYKHIALGSHFVDAHCRLDEIFDKFYDLKSQPTPHPHFPKPVGHKFKFDTYSLRERCASTWFPQYLSCIASFSVSSTDFDEEGNLFEKIIYNDDVWGTIGCHPRDAENYEMDTEAIITAKSLHPKILALGAIGLDFSPGFCGNKDLQKTVLERQLFIATRESAMPIVFHCCEAEDDGFKILTRVLPHDFPVYWHNFNENMDVANKWINYFTNMYFGVSMNILDEQTSSKMNEFYREIPLNRILVESGAPNFLPKEYKGCVPGIDCNHPGLGVLAAFQLAEIRQMDYKELLDRLLENIQRFYVMPFKSV